MMPLENNQDVACFFVTKHSWKGKYKRIFSVGSMGITTYNPQTLEVTNRWSYGDFISVQPIKQSANEFMICMRKERNDRKTDMMRFSSDLRPFILTEALKFRNNFAEKPKEILRYQAYKKHWSDVNLPVVLEVTPYSLDQLDPATNQLLASYNYKDFEGICMISDFSGGFAVVCGGFGRLHLFQSPNADEIKMKIVEAAFSNLGITIKVPNTSIQMAAFQSQRFGKFSHDDAITSVCEFYVQKVHISRHPEPTARILCMTESCLLERDPQTYSICTLRPLSDIFALIRDNSDLQLFSIQYSSGAVRTYIASDRDSILASLLDGVRGFSNRDVHVTMVPITRGLRLGPLHLPVEEDAETFHVKFLVNPPPKHTFNECVLRFNANIAYSGLMYGLNHDSLFSDNKEKLITGALLALVQSKEQNVIELEGQFHALRRLLASKIGFGVFTSMPSFREMIGSKVVNALKQDNVGLTHAAIDMICALLHPMHDDYDLRHEQLNKASVLQSKSFLEQLLNMWTKHITQGTGALVVSAMLDMLTFALCVPYSETTDGKHFDNLLEMVAERGRFLFRLFQHPSTAIVKGAGLVMRALIEEGDTSVANRMQHLALAEGALPCHLLSALFRGGSEQLLTQRQLSRHLVGLWVTGNTHSMSLLERIFPAGLLAYLQSTDDVPAACTEAEMLNIRDNLKMAQQHSKPSPKVIPFNWAQVEKQLKRVENYIEHWAGTSAKIIGQRGVPQARERPVVLRRRRERVKATANWPMFYYKFGLDHSRPNLIWNHKTRHELKQALENEIRIFQGDRELISTGTLIAWNYEEFRITYQCLSDEIKIGDYYLRLLLELDDTQESPIRHSYEFFNDLYHRFLLSAKTEMRCLCLQAMTVVYGKHYAEIGPFSDTKHIVSILEKCQDRTERDRVVLFISKLILHARNVPEVLEAGGIRILSELATLAHLHIARAVVPAQTNVIEAACGSELGQEREWYYSGDKNARCGPLSFSDLQTLYKEEKIGPKTRCWSVGMDNWKCMSQVVQLKWCLLAKGNCVLNDSQLASVILNIFIQMCQFYPSRDRLDDAIIRPLPKVKRLLSENVTLSHIVQLLLTFEPNIVEKVAILLCDIMCDNPEIDKVYLTGVFYFILMYTGSNVLPIANFLKITHMKQACSITENSRYSNSDIMHRSILGHLLPDAMVNYLENHGAEKFAQIFLGEFDTPEAIWNAEMRRMLIGKIAAHIADFTPRLRANVMARYSYLAIPVIRYPQLEKELFCNIYYLRHLCDFVRFPQWPIQNSVHLLKDCLDAWREEVEKKPPSMTVEEAYKSLDLDSKNPDESLVRKSYYRLAQAFHPDKNPDGRERFEQVNKAYEFLCSRSSWAKNASIPNVNNIVLILQTQSILFERYSSDLEPYKYAGYPQLIKTIHLETKDEQLFSKSTQLLTAATELAYHTVHCSSLNVEELRRENGLDIISQAYSRCVDVLSHSSKPNDMAVLVCCHITNCFTVAAQFPQCREKMVELRVIVADLCRILYFKHLNKLCSLATQCICEMAVDSILQMELLKCGALWHLLSFMFNYDYTLDEGGVQQQEDSNQQTVCNALAKQSIDACKHLAGYGSKSAPINQLARTALNNLLTPFITRQLELDIPAEEILKILNSNTESPYLLWNNGTRSELSEFLQKQQTQNRNSSDINIKDLEMFQYSLHKDELQIGSVYVRIYNNQPSFSIADPVHLANSLINYMSYECGFLLNLMDVAYSTTMEQRLINSQMALEALTNVIIYTGGVEANLIGHFNVLFSLLTILYKPIQQQTLKVIELVTRNEECIDDIAQTSASVHVLTHLLLALYTLTDEQSHILNILQALMTRTKLVKEAFARGALLYLLDLFCNCPDNSIRTQSAHLLAKMGADKLMGPKVRLVLQVFLPTIFADAMRDNAETAVNMFETQHEHPELIWDQATKDTVCATVAKLRNEHHVNQMADPSVIWREPDMSNCKNLWSTVISSTTGETSVEPVIGGVYLRIFVANPSWSLRRPKEFLSELMDTCLTLMMKDKPNNDLLEIGTKALCALLNAQPALLDLIPAMGHIPRLCRQMSSTTTSQTPKVAIMIFHALTNSQICIGAIAQSDCMQPLKVAMEARPDMTAVACEALSRLFASNQDQLVKQALEANFVRFLLKLLEHKNGTADGRSENTNQFKAQIVKALKCMSRSMLYGDRVVEILEKNPIWSEYKNQKHDLFIASSAQANYITAATPSNAGYLTQGSTKVPMHVQPPPIDRVRSTNHFGPLDGI